MKIHAIQRCVEIYHHIDRTSKKIIEANYEMKLFEREISIKSEIFPLTLVFDITYRKSIKEEAIGFLYLHTNQGVRTFYIKDEPSSFIHAFKKLKKDDINR